MPHHERSAFGSLLRRFRLAAGLSQEGLAVRSRLSLGAISAYERGVRRSPYPRTVAQLAEASTPLAAAARPLSGRRQQAATAPANHGSVFRDGGPSGRSAGAIHPDDPVMGRRGANAGRTSAGIGMAAT